MSNADARTEGVLNAALRSPHLIIFRPGFMISDPDVMRAWANFKEAVERNDACDTFENDALTITMYEDVESR